MAVIHVGCSLLNAPHMAAGIGYLAGRTWPYLLPGRNQV